MTPQPSSRTAGVSLGESLVALAAFGIMAAGILPLFSGGSDPASQPVPERNVALMDRGVEESSRAGGENAERGTAREPTRGTLGTSGHDDHLSSTAAELPATPKPDRHSRLKTLEAPVISVSSGKFPITQFALPVYLYNSNPPGVSRVMYAVNGGGWQKYAGTAVMASPGCEIAVYAESINSRWANSKFAKEHYEATQVELDAPAITLSAPRFDYGKDRIVEIALENSNASGSSEMEYRASGTRWVFYDSPFRMHVDDNPIGAIIEARAVPAQIYYLESNVSYVNIDKPAPGLGVLGERKHLHTELELVR